MHLLARKIIYDTFKCNYTFEKSVAKTPFTPSHIENDIKIIYAYRINTMTFYEILSDFILSLTMPGAKEGEEQ